MTTDHLETLLSNHLLIATAEREMKNIISKKEREYWSSVVKKAHGENVAIVKEGIKEELL